MATVDRRSAAGRLSRRAPAVPGVGLRGASGVRGAGGLVPVAVLARSRGRAGLRAAAGSREPRRLAGGVRGGRGPARGRSQRAPVDRYAAAGERAGVAAVLAVAHLAVPGPGVDLG